MKTNVLYFSEFYCNYCLWQKITDGLNLFNYNCKTVSYAFKKSPVSSKIFFVFMVANIFLLNIGFWLE